MTTHTTRRHSARVLVVVAVVALLGLPAAPLRAAPPARAGSMGRWYYVGRMSVTRGLATATLLPTGNVLVAGGTGGGTGAYTTAEVYNPRTFGFSLTGSMSAGRLEQTATLLRTGQVLLAGGSNSEVVTNAAELYDPRIGTFTATVGTMTLWRANHTATLLPNGKVLITGGCNGTFIACQTTWASAELYDPATGTFTATGSMSVPRQYHTATLLPNGKVLIAGGASCGECITWSSAELYDPATGTFTPTGSMHVGRAFHTATLLPSGKVLIAGGCAQIAEHCYPAASALTSTELYDPATGTFSLTGSMRTPRGQHMAALLHTVQVLVAGGVNGLAGPPLLGTIITSTELYNPRSGTWTPTGSLHFPRAATSATTLPNGWVLVAGGCFPGGDSCTGADVRSAEVYVP